ncbi:MAG: mandelate racemase/muconate lactonizing enzyme family protein [Deltaproteobacteria bacterium]|nr:mandelate racemase/muconate lactonizing enzyme family protein [Deltaproteobacteria bacterium]
MKFGRRTLLQAALAGSVGTLGKAHASLKKMKITRVRFYEVPDAGPLFNQSMHIVTVETDAGITGIGEGGHHDTVMQCAGMLIDQDPSRIEHLWQLMFRGYFYPAGREKLHGLGALDLALWDIKGKALGVPVHQLMGGLSRDYVECYSTGFPMQGKSVENTARACIKAGFRAFRTAVTGPSENWSTFSQQASVAKTIEHCKEIRKGVGPSGDWAIDYHTRIDFPDAVRLSKGLEPLEPLFCEDLVRSEAPAVYKQLRPLVKVPIAVGEQFGARWDINELVEQHLIDYSRVTIPNVGGITEMLKLAALCETHYVGLVPHFTGQCSVAALVHVLGCFGGNALMEMGKDGPQAKPHLIKSCDFKNGKLYPNDRPGLGVEVDLSKLKMTGEVTKAANDYHVYKRPDGSFTNW